MKTRLPISPATIYQAANGRFMYYDTDVTDHPFWWNCPNCDTTYQETLAVMTTRDDGQTACPWCKVAAGLCAAPGCWDPATVVCRCECGVHTHSCRTHADLTAAASEHCGRPVHVRDLVG